METDPTTAPSVAYYDGFWKRFRASSSIHPANLYRYELVRHAILKYASGATVLVDFGCGNGTLIGHLQGSTSIRQFLGVDASVEIVKANQQLLPDAKFSQADLQVELTDNFRELADVVICCEVIEHLGVYQPLLRSAAKALRKDGVFILTTQGGKRRRHDIELLGHVRHFRLAELAADVQQAGFVILEQRQCGFPILNLQKIMASLFLNRVKTELASESEPSALFQLACKVVGVGLRVSSRWHGPQLLIVARRAEL